MSRGQFITRLAERDAMRDHTEGRFTPYISFTNRGFLDETCEEPYMLAYAEKYEQLSKSANRLETFRAQGLL